MRVLRCLGLLAVLGMSGSVFADPLNFNFSGNVSAECGIGSEPVCPVGLPGVGAGDLVTGAFGFNPTDVQFGGVWGYLSVAVGTQDLSGPALFQTAQTGTYSFGIRIRSDFNPITTAALYLLLDGTQTAALECNADRSLSCPLFPTTPDYFLHGFILELRDPLGGPIGLDPVQGNTSGVVLNANPLTVRIATVPEPSTLILLSLGLIAMFRLRRH